MRAYDTTGRPERTDVLQAALQQAGRGRAVFPLRGKIPATRRGFKDASRQPQQIAAMFNATKDASGYGIATGRASGVVVVDVDGPGARAEAERLGVRSGHVVRTGRVEGDGWHVYFSVPPGVEVRSRQLAPGVELKGDGSYVVGPGSLHPSGDLYTVIKNGEPAPAPEWITTPPEPSREDRGQADRGERPVSVDTAGPAIPEGERNCELTRVAGRLHDGTRGLDVLAVDLEAINTARCTPPLDACEVRRIAASIHRREPCNPRPEVTPAVLAAVDYLESVERPVKGMAGGSGWSIYHAGLRLARQYGREHPDGVAVSLDVRTWALEAGSGRSTVARFIRRSPLVRLAKRGQGHRASVVVFVTPKGYKLGHSSTRGVTKEHPTFASVPPSTLRRILQRLRWGPGRIGKSRAAILALVADCEGTLTRAEIADRLGRKPNALKAPLRWLVESGLLLRVGRGLYTAPDAYTLRERVEDARELGLEPEADRLQLARHARERAAYRKRDKIQPDPAPTVADMDAARQQREASGEIADLERVEDAGTFGALGDLYALLSRRVNTSRGPGVLWQVLSTELRVILDADPSRWVPIDHGELLGAA